MRVRVYEVKSGGAATNAEILWSDDKKHFFWNQRKFEDFEIGDHIFFVNKTGKWMLYTTIGEKDIETQHDSVQNRTRFDYSGKSFDIEDNGHTFQKFVKFEVHEKADFHGSADEWKSLGSSEVTDLFDGDGGVSFDENRLTRINQLSDKMSSHEVKEILDQTRISLLETKDNQFVFPENSNKKKLFLEVINDSEIKRIVEMEDFYLQKGQDALEAAFTLAPGEETLVELEQLIEKYESGLFEQLLLEHSEGTALGNLLRVIGRVVAYSDTNAAAKNEFNEYSDKRVVARTQVRQNIWISSLIKIIRERDFKTVEIPDSVKNALEFLSDPTTGISITGMKHRLAIANRFLGGQSAVEEFTSNVKLLFNQFEIPVKNEKNRTFLYSRILYHEKIRPLWEEYHGLICVDSGTWFQDYQKEFDAKGKIALWWSAPPVDRKVTIPRLKSTLKKKNDLYIYYTKNRHAFYKARIIDFVLSEKDYLNSSWREDSNIARLQSSFEDYKGLTPNGNETSASIVMLADRFESIDPPISIEQFDFVRSSDGLTQDNLQPIYGFHDEFDMHEKNDDYGHVVEEFRLYLQGIHKNHSTSNDYIKMMPKIQEWFIQNKVSGKDFNIWRDDNMINSINARLNSESRVLWKDLNKKGNQNNWYMSPWNKWVEFNNQNKKETSMKNPKDLIDHVHRFIEGEGFRFSKEEISNFYLSLRTKPFVILAGISGTGKTQLPRLFAKAVGMKKNQVKLVSVRPDWTDGSDLLGYTDLNGTFHPEKLTLALAEATDNPEAPYFFILDEMNLARVEFYFSEFLSVIETRERDDLEIKTDSLVKYNGIQYGWPQNLFLIGTVNMDETTHSFSRKVLDRANTIEMNNVNLAWTKEGKSVSPLSSIDNNQLVTPYIKSEELEAGGKEFFQPHLEFLKDINAMLQPADIHFAYRVRDEIAFYMYLNADSKLISVEDAMDFQLMQKILPRIHGSSQRIQTVLVSLLNYLTGLEIKPQTVDMKQVESLVNESWRFEISKVNIQTSVHALSLR